MCSQRRQLLLAGVPQYDVNELIRAPVAPLIAVHPIKLRRQQGCPLLLIVRLGLPGEPGDRIPHTEQARGRIVIDLEIFIQPAAVVNRLIVQLLQDGGLASHARVGLYPANGLAELVGR